MSRLARCFVAAVTVAAAALAACLDQTLPARAAQTSSAAPPLALGVYTGPAAKNLAGAAAFESWSGSSVTRLIEFLPDTTWLEMTRIDWALSPYTGSGYQLELSVPLLPRLEPGVSLEACAAGEYDARWRSIAESLMKHRLPEAQIRPGWEMNGDWYPWSAIGKTSAYAGCFRSLVKAMRAVEGQRFTFVFSVNVGLLKVAADEAYPGDDVVDAISVDVYDLSWTWYPTPAGVTTEQARTNAWSYVQKQDRGLDWWASYARSRHKQFGISEWGLTWRSDGRGGGDNPAFVDRMFDWLTDPANSVSFANYFNSPDSAALKHDLMRADTDFPASAARFRERASAVAPRDLPSPPDGVAPHDPGPAPELDPVLPTLARVDKPRITGRPRPGAKLKASAGNWSPRAASVSWQWYRGNRRVPGATSRRYRVKAADAGHRMRVRVTVKRSGYRPNAARSARTARVRR